MSELVFYDIPGKTPGTKAWSPHSWNARYVLNYKGLKYRTEWVDYPDIEPLCKKIGAGPTSTKSDGVTPHFTCPILCDPSNGVAISDSAAITSYLDKTYPDTPTLIPSGTHGLHAAFQTAFESTCSGPIYHILVHASLLNLEEPSHTYFKITREELFGMRLEDVAPEGEAGERRWKNLEDGLRTLASWFKQNGDSPFILGDTPSYADIQIAARLTWAKRVLGENSKGWARIRSFDDGRWARFLERFKAYETVI